LLVPEEVRPIVDQIWRDLLAQKGGTRSTNDNFTKDGRLITCDWYNTPLVGVEGQVIGVASLVDDITERKRLEQQIQESLDRRSRQIQAITNVAQQVSGTLTLNDLFQQVVDLMLSQFGYYHAQIYTMVEADMVLQAGTGEIGRRLKENDHKIPLSAEQSLVVRAVWAGESVLVPDVSQEPTWLPNPLLPETKAELAVPITLGAEILGVLDVQSDKLDSLNEEDRLLLTGLCGQIAIAIETRRAEAERAQLLMEVERRARREQTIREITEKMRAAPSLEGLVKTTATELGKRLSAGHAVVELGIEPGIDSRSIETR
jgi:putative methionine-R-sulfoxide reductase with GAF domain